MGDLGFCTIVDIANTTYTSLLSDIPADFGMPFFFIRLLHNKLSIFSWSTLKCFFQYFDIEQITQFLPPVLIPYIAYFLIRIPKKKVIYSLLGSVYIFFILDPFHWNLGTKIIIYQVLYFGLSILGGILFTLRLNKRKLVHG
ncbi:hypothetical protein HYW55_02115 [Candidatus Gottesmanbacteria bacterium]|nr:hypothetical protein [Candidatus Gottesmanbacteria bacterium]